MKIKFQKDQDEPIITEDEGELAIDIYEDEASIYIVAPVAGISKDSLQVEINEDILSISGERPKPETIKKGKKIFLQECFWGKFTRSIILPVAINSAETKATFHLATLLIEIPKARKVSAQHIFIKS